MSQADAVSTRTLPPGVSDSDFERAIEDFTASAVLMPTTVEEIQAVVRIANERRVPLWTHGTGRNNGYGGPAPRVRGSVIVSLRNMNRVLEINEELGYAVVEPGVRWFDDRVAERSEEHTSELQSHSDLVCRLLL